MSFKIEHPRRELLGAAVLALILWGFYLRTLSPAFPPDDSPETITAAVTLGIQHPPGYPLPTLLGRCAVLALPLGSMAWRVNLLSAGLGVLAALLAGLLALKWAGTQSGAFRASAFTFTVLAVGLMPAFWDQATEAKGGFYLLNLALGFSLWLAVLAACQGRRAATAWAGLLAGLMLAGHFLSAGLWLLPLGGALLWGAWRGRVQGWGLGLALLVPGLVLYAYLPLRAALYPYLDIGHPVSWAQLWWVLGRGGYTQAGLGPAWPIVSDQLTTWAWSLVSGMAVGLPLLAVLGGRWLWRRWRAAAWLVLAAFGLALLAGGVVNKTPPDNRWLALIFLLPATVLLAPLAGLGWARWGATHWPRLALPLALLLTLGPAWMSLPAADRSGSLVGWDFAHDLALSLPRGALYLAEGDYHSLPLFYLQGVEGRRLDVQVVLNALSGDAWYQAWLAHQDPGLVLPVPGPAAQAAPALALANAGRRPVIVGPFSQWLTSTALRPWGLIQHGLARRLARRPRRLGAEADVALAWAARPPARDARHLEAVEAALLPWYSVALVQDGNESLAVGDAARAAQDDQRALARPGQLPRSWVLFDLGQAQERLGQPQQARASYAAALAAQPDFAAASQRLQALDRQTAPAVKAWLRRADTLAAEGGQDDAALALYQRALQAGFQNAGLWRNVGVLCLREGRPGQAVTAFGRGLDQLPGDKTLLLYLQAAQEAQARQASDSKKASQ